MNIVFICTGNTCRSPMAEGICNKIIKDRNLTDICCSSCGLAAFAGDCASENAVLAAARLGADISAHRSTPANAYLLSQCDAAVCMTQRHKAALESLKLPCRIFVPCPEISDPYGGDLDVYLKCAQELDIYISNLLDALTAEICPMTQSETTEIAEIEKLCFSAPWSEDAVKAELENEAAHFLCAKTRGRVLGYIGVHEVCGEAYIANAAVRPEFRRMGLGEKLIKSAAENARRRGCEFISLEVRKSNAPAIELYKKQGYNTLGERKRFYTNPVEDAAIMTKNLKE